MTRIRVRRYWSVPIAMLILALLFVPGCGSKDKKQDFVNDYLNVIDNLRADPGIAEEGRKAALAYQRSGCTDLESADIARESYEMSIEKDQETLKTIESMVKPDKEAENIAAGLSRGIEKIDEASSEYADKYRVARDQSVEERIASSQDIKPIMETIMDGLTEIKGSLDILLSYIEDNGLEGEEEVRVWFNLIDTQISNLESSISD